MTKKRSSKRALLMSGLAMLTCMTMLIGSTFAWFTDSVTSSGNIIKSGTLDVSMDWADGTKAVPADESTEWTDASTGEIFNNDKWEPGYVDAKHIKISNKGTLALKYQLNILANGTVSKLADVIDVYFADGGETLTGRDMTGLTRVGTLTEVLAGMPANMSGDLKEKSSDIVTIALKMQETANNDYQGLEIGSDFAVQLFATQLTSEKDSFDETYDKFADYDGEISGAASLKAALTKGGTYKVLDNITVDETMTIPADVDVKLNLNGKTIEGNVNRTVSNGMIVNNGNLVIYGDGAVMKNDVNYGGSVILNTGDLVLNGGTYIGGVSVPAEGKYASYAVNTKDGGVVTVNNATIKGRGAIGATNGASVVINDGLFEATTEGDSAHVVYVANGKVTINGGTFNHTRQNAAANGDVLVYITDDSVSSAEINGGIFDGAKAAITYSNMNVAIKGGTFKNSAKNVFGGGTFAAKVADGYVTTKNADGTYTVVKGATVANVDDLKDALANGGNIVLSDDIELTSTLPAKEDVVIDLNGNTITAPSGSNMFQSSSDTDPSIIISSSTAGAEINVSGGDTSVLLGYGSTVIKNVTINVNGCDNKSPNPFNVYGDLTLGEGTVVNVDYLGTALINNNGKVAVVIDGAQINVGTFKTNGTAIITLNQASTLEMKNTNIKIDNFVLSSFGGDSLVSKVDGVTIDGCTFDVTDSNGASCTFVAKDGKYRLVQK